MTYLQIKSALILAGSGPAKIAKKLGINQSTVTRVIQGKKVSRRVRVAVAKTIGKQYAQVWTEAEDRAA